MLNDYKYGKYYHKSKAYMLFKSCEFYVVYYLCYMYSQSILVLININEITFRISLSPPWHEPSLYYSMGIILDKEYISPHYKRKYQTLYVYSGKNIFEWRHIYKWSLSVPPSNAVTFYVHDNLYAVSRVISYWTLKY